MNNYLNLLIKLLIFLVLLVLIMMTLFFAKFIDFDIFKKDEIVNNPSKTQPELSKERVKKINDSLEQRDDRIKALKEIGKKLGG